MIRRVEDRLRKWLVGREFRRALATPWPMYRCSSCGGTAWHEDGVEAARKIHVHMCAADPVAMGREITRALRQYGQSQGL